LDDPDEAPRAAAATAVGQLRVSAAIPKLRTLLDDKDLSVVIAAAHALIAMKDDSAYDAYYAILTGERRGKGLVAQQLDTLRDPKKLATLGVSEAIGFVPFASIGWDAMRAMRVDDSSAVRAVAASVLANDPDPKSLEALKAATTDKSWLVRIAALQALAQRKDPSVIGRIELSMYDSRSEVRYTAAALVVHLSPVTRKKSQAVKG
jgi:HEAT repeat protein